MKTAKAATYLCLALLLCGCSDFCRASAYSGFLPGDAVCLPHTIISAVHLGKDIHNDSKPGGMLNPHGKKTDTDSGEEKTVTPGISNAGSFAVSNTSASLTNAAGPEIKK